MKKLSGFLVGFLDVLVVFAVLAFIMYGLWSIGLVEPPSFLSPLFSRSGTYGGEDVRRSSDILRSAAEEENYDIIQADMSKENVKKMLSLLEPEKDFTQEIEYSLMSGTSSLTERVIITMREDISVAHFISGTDEVTKQVVYSDGTTSVSTVLPGGVKTVSYQSGKIAFSEQVGALLTYEDFLDVSDDDDYSFSLISSESGTMMLISFTSRSGEYTQEQTYKLSLEYGVVTEAYCYENDALIYSLSTSYIGKERNASPSIPDELLNLLPAGVIS